MPPSQNPPSGDAWRPCAEPALGEGRENAGLSWRGRLVRLSLARRVLFVAVALIVAGDWSSSALPADVHVAVDGSDAADGSPERPVASLRRALDRVREIRAAAADRETPIVVEVADGQHELADTLMLRPEDSGTAAAPTVIRASAAARPVISGGRLIRSWEPSADGRGHWMARLPAVEAGEWRFGQLFVNGQRRFRPVLPAAGWYTIAATLPPSPAAAGKGHDGFGFSDGDIRSDWTNIGDVEVVAVHRWSMSRMRIAAIGPLEGAGGESQAAGGSVRFTGRTMAPSDWSGFPAGNRFFVENVGEAVGEPGSWYLDRKNGILTYCPRPGETPEAAEVVAPRLDRLVRLEGDPASGRMVEHVRFEGLTFAHGNWTLDPAGQSFPQADINVGGSVSATGVRHVAFVDCRVRHVGRYAIEFGGGCSDCTVERCDLADLGGGGVLIGTGGGAGSWGEAAAMPRAVERIAIRDTTIRHGGRIHSAAVGVWIGHATHCTVEHCDIHDFTYTGVSVGWIWGYEESRTHHIRIASNRIHHLGYGVLSDMGGVYTLGVSPGTVVEDNVIHDIASHDYGGWGLYTDEGSTGIVMRGNLVYRTSSGGFHQHYGRDNLVENNVFAAARDWQLQRSRVEDHTSFTFTRNVVWWDSNAPLMHGDWLKGVELRDNCYWNAVGPVRFPEGGDLVGWQQAGQDAGSLVADPMFADPAAGDFTLAADSPVVALGWQPIDPTKAGPRGPTPKDDLAPVPSIWPERRVSP